MSYFDDVMEKLKSKREGQLWCALIDHIEAIEKMNEAGISYREMAEYLDMSDTSFRRSMKIAERRRQKLAGLETLNNFN